MTPFCLWAASPVYRCRNGFRAVVHPRYNRHMMTPCQVCGGTIDAARSEAAQLRRKAPTYCSSRCYRAGIKRTYRAKRRGAPPLAIDAAEAKRELRPADFLEAGRVRPLNVPDEVLEELSDDQRSRIEQLAKSIAKALNMG
jgi:hypothetical protein